MFFYGMSIAFSTCIAYVWLMEMWSGKSASPLNLNQLMHSLGRTVGPLLLAVFIVSNKSEAQKDESIASGLFYPSVMTATVSLALALLFWLLLNKMSYSSTIKHKDSTQHLTSSRHRTEVRTHTRRYYYTVFISGLVAVCFAAHVNTSTVGLLPKFLMSSNPGVISKSLAASMSSVVAISTACGQVTGVILQAKVNPSPAAFTCLVLAAISSTMLLLFAASDQLTVVWIALVILGLGISCTYSSILCLIHCKITFSDWESGAVSFAGMSLIVVINLVSGSLIEEHPVSIMIINLCCTAVTFIALIILVKIKDADMPEIETDEPDVTKKSKTEQSA